MNGWACDLVVQWKRPRKIPFHATKLQLLVFTQGFLMAATCVMPQKWFPEKSPDCMFAGCRFHSGAVDMGIVDARLRVNVHNIRV